MLSPKRPSRALPPVCLLGVVAWLIGGAAHASPSLNDVTLLHAPAGANAQSPVWSADGARLAWEANDHDARRVALWLRDGDAAPRAVAPARPPSSQLLAGFTTRDELGAVVHEAAFANGARRWLSYTVSTGARDYDLHLHGIGPLAAGPTADGGGAWSPTGDKLVFTSSRTGEGDLYLMHADRLDAAPTRLTRIEASAETDATWAPDGREVIFVGRQGPGTQILAVDVATGAVRALSNGPGERLRPSISPSGEHVAYYQRAGHHDSATLVVVPRAGGVPKAVAQAVVAGGRSPAWLDDTRLLVVRDDEAALSPLALVSITGQVESVTSPLVGHGDVAVAPNGRVAVTARGLKEDPARSYRKLYTASLAQ